MAQDSSLKASRVSGSEAGVVFDADPYTTQFGLWLRKKGGLKIEPEAEDDGLLSHDKPNFRMRIGSLLQSMVLLFYSLMTGRRVQECDETRLDPERPYMAFTVDGLVVGERRGVEAKVVFRDQAWKWGTEPESVPFHYQLQCQYYM